MNDAVDPSILRRAVSGYRIPVGSSLADVLSGSTTLLVFLRHRG